MNPDALLAQGIDELGLALPDSALPRLLAFAALLDKWNRTYNLTAIREPHRMTTHHLLDSLAVLPHLPEGRLADVGSGAGLPGVPIAAAQPARAVTLNDANAKKAAFLRQARIELGLDNVDVHEGRVEQWHPHPGYDGVISRGFAELAAFAAACRYLLAPQGVLLAMKGTHPRAEVARLPADIRVQQVTELRVPFLDAERHLVRMSVCAA
ncbi:MAG: 16S rRNA (guanine(527)-N(7))-methyltransferase RsmG [Burkholderiales bacterium]